MRPWSLASLVLAFLVAGTGARAQGSIMPARSVPLGGHIDWSYERDGAIARYESGGVTLTLRGRSDPQSPELILPILTVEMPGLPPIEAEGAETPGSTEHRVTVASWSDGRPYVLFQSYSGGAHCCTQVQAIVPQGRGLGLVDLGEWDGSYLDTLPADLDRDGRLDFVFADNSFLYLFASYADSYAPPLVLNIVGDTTENVSDRPGFRPLFGEAMRDARAGCVNPDRRFEGAAPNGYCAAYVAAAARVGRFEEAWAEMLTHFDMNSDWELPTDCRVEFIDGRCPVQAQVTFEDYPSALRHFLVAAGYIVK